MNDIFKMAMSFDEALPRKKIFYLIRDYETKYPMEQLKSKIFLNLNKCFDDARSSANVGNGKKLSEYFDIEFETFHNFLTHK